MTTLARDAGVAAILQECRLNGNPNWEQCQLDIVGHLAKELDYWRGLAIAAEYSKSQQPATHPEKACATCAFWRALPARTQAPDDGQCRRFPPEADGEFNEFNKVVTVDADYWCGEWKPREA